MLGLVIHVLPLIIKARDTEDDLGVTTRWVLATAATLVLYSGVAGLSALTLTEPSRGDAILSGLAVQSAIKGLFATAEEFVLAASPNGDLEGSG
ncbi:MAG TPA: hypothetical protein VK507_12545 [Iamia sp.]|nr:hypothetical protein [Iamia sp.]